MANKKTQPDKEHEVFIANVRTAMNTKATKDLVWDLLDFCGLNSESFTGNSSTFYNEGKRAVGLYLLSVLQEADPKIYPKLIIEKIEHNEEIR